MSDLFRCLKVPSTVGDLDIDGNKTDKTEAQRLVEEQIVCSRRSTSVVDDKGTNAEGKTEKWAWGRTAVW